MKKNTLKKIKVGLYNPFLDTLGGGEKHILSIIEVFAEKEFEVNIFWDKNLSKEIKNRFSFKYFNKVNWIPNIFKNYSSLQVLKSLIKYDYFFYVTDGSYFFSSAKKNFVFCMVPDRRLYNLKLINKLKLWNYKLISNSPYTSKWLSKWDINPITIPPYIDSKLLNTHLNKEKIILSVGRFFPHLHSKNQEQIIKTFKLLKLSNPSFKDYKLTLAGGLKKEDQKYFDQLKSLAKNDESIIFKPNVALDELYNLYKISAYYWHFTGLNIDENKQPEGVEHFGIAPLEAAISGCITFCHNSGGPKLIFTEGETGFLFNTTEELIKKMNFIETNKILKEKVTIKSPLILSKRYNYQSFKENVLRLL